MCHERVQVGRFWGRRFVERNNETLAFQQAWLLEKEQHEIPEDNLDCDFDAVITQLYNVSSLSIRNKNESRVGIAKNHVALDVIVAKQTAPGTITIDNKQMAPLTAISAF
jgi:hypothetical protein